ncbi:MAG TPA: alpha-amylase family glycosyl hydrolase, partial [Longimicrobiales bacterium]|nr:alpha-amylase family glycosyl hydrolase [Longimicrobiales bacterium]
ERLDYINDGDPSTTDDLGATCVWLMPIMPSPSYHGYDVTNYYDINRDYGTLADFRAFLDGAHERGIHVLIDLVLNHISSEHPYFRDVLVDENSPYRDWFVWSTSPRPSPGWEAPVWHRVQRGPEPDDVEYYYGLFWGGMPDYNLDNPEVKAEIGRIVDFWANDIGVDGFRLDAIGHLFEGPGGQWKNAPQNFPWLREFRDMLERVAPHAFTVGEVYDNHEGVRVYYPDMLHTFFAFELADSLISAVRHGNAAGVAYMADRVQDDIPDQRWGVFLRNHDQTRTLTDMGGDVARVRLAAALQLTLPGLPFVYYGEELGMTGDKRHGDIRLRTPMAWSREPGVGFTEHVPWEPLPWDSLTANVEAQDDDPSSMLNHYRRLIQLRTSNEALQTGDFVPLAAPGHPRALAYLRRAEDGGVVVVLANLSEQPLSGVRLTSEVDALREGRYVPRVVFGGGTARNMTVGRDGRISGWTMADLGPLEVRVIELTRHN